MAKASFEFTGLTDLLAKVRKLDEGVAKAENKALRAGAKPLQQKMSETVHMSELSGENYVHIRDDIRTSTVKESAGEKWIEVGPGKRTDWRARFLELGHLAPDGSQVPAYPFIEPSIKQSKDVVQKAMGSVLKEALDVHD